MLSRRRPLTRLRSALGNRFGLGLFAAGLLIAALLLMIGPSGSASLAVSSLLFGLLAYLLTCAIYYWAPESSADPPQIKALRRLRAGIAEQLDLHGESEALRRVLTDALDRLDHEMIPSTERLLQRHGLLQRDLQRFRSGEMLAPDAERLGQLQALADRQEQAVEHVGQQVANAYASLVMLAQQSDDEPHLADSAREWSNALFETQENLAELLDDTADFDRRLEERANRPQAT